MNKFFKAFEKRAAVKGLTSTFSKAPSAIKSGLGPGMQKGMKPAVSSMKVPTVGRTTKGISSHLI